MLFVEETHAVIGSKEDEFESAYRDGWMPALGSSEEARLLWYLQLAHGTGLSYRVVTITAVRDGAAWERLAARVQHGDLRTWARAVDACRHQVCGRILANLDFAPLNVDLAEVSTVAQEGPPCLYMQDTVWPLPGMASEYVKAAAAVYAPMLEQRPTGPNATSPLTLEGALRTVPGGGRSPEIVLMQKVHDEGWLIRLLTEELPQKMTRPGSWMHDALRYRERWESRLLRTAPWSPWR